LGLVGLVDSGRTEILKAISGIEPAEKRLGNFEGLEIRKFTDLIMGL